ncbi:MAG: GNAT family N-acetyltransferase, partial [Actinobacteria bacterium]|nr:GNAT family N-acetyltransferase [Actinomycetota bacterium]
MKIPIPDPPLRDDAVALRPWKMSDVPVIAAICQDAEIPRWTTVPRPYSEQNAREFVLAMTSSDLENTLALAIVTKAGEVVGSLTMWIVTPGVVEFGYWVSAEERGRGYMPRALLLLARWTVDTMDIRRLQLGTIPGNSASERVAEKTGFSREGVLRSFADQRG